MELVLSGIASFAIATAAGEEFGIATYAKASVAGEGDRAGFYEIINPFNPINQSVKSFNLCHLRS